jgi:hypothetical protein
VKILGYIISAKIGDGSWHGTAKNFILNWQEQIRLYERLTPATGHFSDEQKLTMLQTAVRPLQELRQVKATAALLKVHTQQDLTYDAYFTLLLATASEICQNGDMLEDVIDQCVLGAQISQGLDLPIVNDTHETELGTQGPEDSPLNPLVFLVLRLSQSVTLTTISYTHSLVGLTQTSSRRPLSTPRNMLDYLLVPCLKKAFKSPNPALNAYRCQEDVACDIVYSEVSAICDGSTAAVIFVGVSTPSH